MDEVLKDERFAHVAKDPRFRRMQKHQRKIKIDKRFQSMFNDEKFKLKYSVDKRGRPVNTSTNENLKKYYEMSSEESEPNTFSEEEHIEHNKKVESKKNLKKSKSQHGDNNATEKVAVKQINSNKWSESADKKAKKVDTYSKAKPNSSLKQCDKSEDYSGVSSLEDSSTELESTDVEKDAETCNLESDNSESGDGEEEVTTYSGGNDEGPDYARGEGLLQSSSDEDTDEDDSEDNKTGPDLARGEGLLESSSEEDTDEDDGEDDKDDFDHGWGEMDKEAPLAEEITTRLALCNMDWDRIKAQDILVMLNSFKPMGGTIKTVHIYPSEFGKKRMQEEELKGPTELVESRGKQKPEEDGEGSEFHREKLREYQLKRLKYYYAVAECDSAETANHIYEQCDGIEYEGSGNRLDLRFIPKDMTFDDKPKSVATDMSDLAVYKPSMYTSTALQQSAVQCTWDETDQDRIKVTMKQFDQKEIEEMDLKDYLASDSEGEGGYEIKFEGPETAGSDSENEDKQINKYRQLLQEISDKDKSGEKDMEMEITWEPGLKDTTETLVKKKTSKKDLTPWESYLEKKKEKKKSKKEKKQKEKKQVASSDPESEADNSGYSDDDLPAGVDLNDPYFKEEIEKLDADEKKSKKKKKKGREKLTPEEQEAKQQREAELKLLLMDEDDQRQHFNLKQLMEQSGKRLSKKKLRKLKKQQQEEEVNVEDNFQLEVDDPRFKVLFENPHFNIDPSAPEFKKTKAMDMLIEEKLKRAKHKKKKGKKASISSNADTEGNEKGREIKAQKHKQLSADDNKQSKKKKVESFETDKSGNSVVVNKNMDLLSLIKSVKAKTKVLENKKRKK